VPPPPMSNMPPMHPYAPAPMPMEPPNTTQLYSPELYDRSRPVLPVHDAHRKMKTMENVGQTMQYDLKVATRESKLLAGEKRDLEGAIDATSAHAEARIEAVERERDQAKSRVSNAEQKRNWAEHRLQQEEEETANMRRKVAQVLADSGAERQSSEAKLEALRGHVKSQDVSISNLRHTHMLQRGEWEESLKEAGKLRREREEELFKVHEEHTQVLQDRKALEMNLRNEVHAHKEAIIGHIKDKEYLDSRLAQARDAHAAVLSKHDLLAREIAQAKAEHKSKVDQLTDELMNNRIDYEKRLGLAKEEYESSKSTLIKEHQTRTHMTVEDHQKRCDVYEEALAKAKAATQERIAELGRITAAADEAAAVAAGKQAQLEMEVAEAKAEIGRLDLDLDHAKRDIKTQAAEQAQVRKMLEDALAEADTLTANLRGEVDRMRNTMAEQAATAKREISKLENDLEGALADYKALTREKQMMEDRLSAEVEEQTKLKEREVWEHDQSKRRLEETSKELMVTSHARDEAERKINSLQAEMARQEVAMKAEQERQVAVLMAEHQRRCDSYEDALTNTRREVDAQVQLVGKTRAELQAQKDATMKVQKEFDLAAQEWHEDRTELQLRLQAAEKARRNEMMLKEKALTQEQEMHMQLLSARGELELALKDTGRLRSERDEVTVLCESTHEKKEMYKKRLLDATESVETMSTELEFSLNESNILRQEKLEAIKQCELVSWEKEMVETTLQEEIEAVIEDKEEAEIQRDEAQRILEKEMKFSTTLRLELKSSLRENDDLKKEMEDVDVGVTTASLRVSDLHSSQKELLDNHVPEYVASRTKPVTGRNYGHSSLRQLAVSQNLGATQSVGWKEPPNTARY